MSNRNALTVHYTINEAAAQAATWRRVTGRRFAVRADHTDGWGNRPRWAVVATG